MNTREKNEKKTEDTSKFKSVKAITLISLVITIIVLIILASVAIYLSLNNNGIFTKAKEAKELTNKQEATDIINLKITTAQMNKYAEKQEMPTLQELADVLYEDDEIQYVLLESKIANKEKVTVGDKTSIYTKLNDYPYEFEINSSLQLASINGIKVATDTASSSGKWKKYMMNENGYVIGTEKITLPDKYEELHIKVSFKNTANSSLAYNYNILYEELTEAYQLYYEGFGYQGNSNYAYIMICKKDFYINGAQSSGSNKYNDAKIEVWYK